MSQPTVMVNIKILDKELQIACPESEKEGLLASAELLHQRMKQVRDSGKVYGVDRIAIIAALNLTHELLQQREERRASGESIQKRVETMQERVERTLRNARQIEI